MQPRMNERWLTTTQAARITNTCKYTMRLWADRGTIRSFVAPNGHYFLLEADVLKYEGVGNRRSEKVY